VVGTRERVRFESGIALTVTDLGAGNERLRPLLADTLSSPHEHLPYDLYPQRPTTIRLDVSHQLPSREFDLVF